MKGQILFSRKSNKNIFSQLPAESAHSIVSVNHFCENDENKFSKRFKVQISSMKIMSRSNCTFQDLHCLPFRRFQTPHHVVRWIWVGLFIQ